LKVFFCELQNLNAVYSFGHWVVGKTVPEECFFFSSQGIGFNTTFYASPAVLVSGHHYYDRQVNSHIPPENNIIAAWVEVKYSILL